MFSSDYAEAKEVFNKIVHSYNVLSDENQRRIHDADIDRPKQSKPPQPQKDQRADRNTKKQAFHFKSHYYEDEFYRERQIPRKFPKKPKEQAPSESQSHTEFTNQFKSKKAQNNNSQKYDNDRPKYRSSYTHKRNSNSLVLLIIFAFMIAWYMFPTAIKDREPLFVFTANNLYQLKLKTKVLKAPYFVKADYDPVNFVPDEAIEAAYVRKIEKQCQKSLNQKKMLERLAQKAVNQVQKTTFISAADGVDLKSCKKIIKLIKKHPTTKLSTFTNNIIGL